MDFDPPEPGDLASPSEVLRFTLVQYRLAIHLFQDLVQRILSGESTNFSDVDKAARSLVGTAIFDVVPPGNLPGTYVSLGPEDVRDQSDPSGAGSEHRFVVSVVTDAAGFQTAKTAAAAVSDAIVNADFSLTRGRVVALSFVRAQAQRVQKGDVRRIDLTFRARVEDD